MNKTFLAVALTALTFTGVAGAADYGADAQGKTKMPAKVDAHADFVKLDANKDGYLEKDEVSANKALKKNFDKIADHGKLSESKFSAWENRRQAKRNPE